MNQRRRSGANAEAAARTLLLRAGLSDVAANASFRLGELDLVMLDEATAGQHRPGKGVFKRFAQEAPATGGASLVFVEVRYRAGADFGGGAQSVDAAKQRKLVRAAQQFLLAHPHFADANCRFDVIEAEGDPDAPRLRWIKDAFRADDW